MLKIQIPTELSAKISAALAALPAPTNDKNPLHDAALTAGEIIKYYSEEVPEMFAAHAAPFFRSKTHATEVGRITDAAETLLSFRTRAILLQTACANPENLAWLKHVFDCALSGQLDLRLEPHQT